MSGRHLWSNTSTPPSVMCNVAVSPPDVAISAPYGGTDRYGLVYIHNGRSEGPNPSPSQVNSAFTSTSLLLFLLLFKCGARRLFYNLDALLRK